ncbi:diacylglycerol kinase family protein [Altericroceibacterium xinjiangense]|uniref:diacylglycerol kinase family protein n=1 Tax=Altericroceibacterium xinjiangense TaxID=762261 RepID=UPI000F7F22D1|nr:diacylglycerol kinase family protein [Altericroceibacterium xinjiangense]
MARQGSLWLVVNEASGSNDAAALEALNSCCGDAGFHVARTICFPEDPLPTAAELDAAGVGVLAVFAGDGTTSAVVTSLYGWNGAILVLPGGTMNLLYHRLHGETALEAVVHTAASGLAQPVRPLILRSPHGDALAELLAGPGTVWSEVREAMRSADVVALTDRAAQAIEQSVAAPMIACIEPEMGRDQGYPLLMLCPREKGIEVNGYYSDTLGDYFNHGLAMLRHNFRTGPHDELGLAEALRIVSLGGGSFGLAFDGELKEGGPAETFRLARCEVDLLATHYHG